jgi:hypothetical protein
MALLDPARVLSRANLVLKELQASALWKAALETSAVGSTPLLVTSIAPPVVQHRNDKPLRMPDYYVVSLLRGSAISARFAHHAETGNLLEAEGVKKAGTELRPYVDPLAIVQSEIAKWSKDAGGGAAPKPVAVWRPCRESTSRFVPFWRFQFENQTLYVRADGKVFGELTVTGRG